MEKLEPITPEEALDMYLVDRETEITESTLYSHRSRLGHFVTWCRRNEIENLNELTGRNLHEFRLWRRDDGDLEPYLSQTGVQRVTWKNGSYSSNQKNVLLTVVSAIIWDSERQQPIDVPQ